MNTNKLIPRKIIFSHPDKVNAKLSSDGKYISYLARHNNVLNIFVAPSKDFTAAKALTNDKKRGITNYLWAKNNKHIIYQQDNDGDENFYLHILDIETLNDVVIKVDANTKINVIKTSTKYPDEIVIGLNDRRKDLFDLYKLNLNTGKKEILYKNDKFIGFMLDRDYNIIFASSMDKEGGLEIFHNNELYMRIPQCDVLTTHIVCLTKDQDYAYFLDSRGRDKTALFLLNIKTKEQKLLFERNDTDISGITIHPDNKNLQAVSTYYKRSTYYTSVDNKPFDKEFEDDFMLLKEKFPSADISIHSKTLTDDRWIILAEYDTQANEYYLFTRSTKKCQFLFQNKADLKKYRLNKMEPVSITSRDGLELVSYLTRPNSTPKKVSPMVLLVHGGPNARDYWGHNAIHQWLSNRGYAVLSVNYRGSTGFGKHFINAGNGQWAGKMHDDLIDAVNWAVENGIAQKDKIAIMGGSYGGYATLVGLTFTPDVFACGVDIVGPSNLITLGKSIPEYWKPILKNLILKIGGDPNTKHGQNILKQKSPLFFAEKITKPLLIGQGANDPRVKQQESDQIVARMKSKNIPVTYVLYPDEGHGFQRPENSISFYAIAEVFLADILGGKAEPIVNDFLGASLKIIEGKERILYKPAD